MRVWLKKHRLLVLAVGLFMSAIFCFYVSLFPLDFSRGEQTVYGVTFSAKYAESLGLDWQQAFIAALDDLKVRDFRLAAYWDEIEVKPGEYDFISLDWQVEKASQRFSNLIIVVGRRVPRWPECHDPVWLKRLTASEVKDRQLKFIKALIIHYRQQPSIKYWQVENEPLLAVFGECPKPDPIFLQQEIDLVRSLDSRPILTTDSGELSTWQSAAEYPDILGTSLYRIVWNKYLGFWDYWFVPPAYYYYKAELTKWLHPKLQSVIITELQMEPWTFDRPMTELSYQEQRLSFDESRFRNNIGYVRKTGLRQVYLWGVEYWYWLDLNGHPELWQEAKKIWQ